MSHTLLRDLVNSHEINNEAIKKILLECNPKELDQELLLLAAEKGHLGIIPLLLSLGIRPHTKDIHGRTASELAKAWLESSPSLNTPDLADALDVIKTLEIAELKASYDERELAKKIDKYFSPDIAEIFRLIENVYVKNKEIEALKKEIEAYQKQLASLLKDRESQELEETVVSNSGLNAR